MKRITLLSLLMVGTVCAVWVWSQASAQPEPLARLFPAGSLLYLEARDFRGLLADWNNSAEKKLWLASDNYQEFSRTNLFLKLADAQQEFAQVAGFVPGFAMVQAVAGQNAALAIYDIGELEFLYVTRIETSAALESVLLQRRSSYESRSVAGKAYHVRRLGKRTAAFAFTDGLLILATREDLVAGALKLLAQQQEPSLIVEDWFARAVTAQQRPAGDLRMVLNIRRLVETPQFRSYWIQRNVSELRPFRSGVVDVLLEAGRWREERVLVREEALPSAAVDTAGVAQVLAWAPDDAGLRRAWASPSCSDVSALLNRKIFSPGSSEPSARDSAPAAASPDNVLGAATDLEVRIDEQALEQRVRGVPESFTRACEQAGLSAALHVQRSRTAPDGVYVDNEVAIALLATRDWPEIAIEGVQVERRGRALVLASTPEMLAGVGGRLGSRAAGAGASYSARYSHARELEPFRRMMTFIDTSKSRPEYAGPAQPAFFSGNVASLGQVLARLRAVDVSVLSNAEETRQVVVYTVQ